MPLADAPVWSFYPNWASPVVERLEFSTDVLGSGTGVEQRRKLRDTPRRSFEFDLLLRGSARTYFDLWNRKFGVSECWLPLWPDVTRLTAIAAPGSTVLFADPSFRDFRPGEGAVLIGDDPFIYELVEISDVGADSVTVSAETERWWGKGARLLPARLAALTEQPVMQRRGDDISTTTVRLETTQPNVWDAEYEISGFDGLPVLLSRPNEIKDMTVEFARLYALFDPGFGKRKLFDRAARSFTTQEHAWHLSGAQARSDFRSMVYALQGRLRPVWLPTFAADLKPFAPAVAGSNFLNVETTGLAATGLQAGREYIVVELSGGGFLFRRVNGVLSFGNYERVSLNANWPVNLAIRDIRRISFMDVARLDQDSVQITHVTDIEGVAEASLVYKTIPRDRDDTPVVMPYTPAVMDPTPCGDPG